jgi:sulfonate transport system substrate-binding protein
MQRTPRNHLPRRALFATVAVAALALAACGSDGASSSPADAAADTVAPVDTTADATTGTTAGDESATVATDATAETTESAPADTAADEPAPTIPPGTVLRIGDQGGGLETPLRLAGELDDVPYEVEFATFASGPLVNEAFAADAIDIGILGDTPALLSYAAGLDTVVVGVRSSDGVAQTLVAAPGSGIESLEDLEGKSIAWTTGTNQHGFVLRALDSVGLTQDDVQQVDVPLTDVANVLAGGQADAAVLYEVFRPPYIDEHPDAVELVTLQDFVPSYIYLLAARDVAEDPAKAAAIEDFVARLVHSGQWVDENPDAFIQAYFVEGQKQTPEYGKQAYDAQGFTEWIEPGGQAQIDQQEQADLFYAAGFLPEEVDLGPQFDPELTSRFTTAIQEAQQ